MTFTNRRLLLGAGLFAAVVAFAVWIVFFKDGERVQPPEPPHADAPHPPDPRLTYATPFRNVKPHVRYVGDQACATCHVEIDQKYHAHPMGRSAVLVGKSDPIEQFDAAAHNPTAIGPYELFVEKTGDKMLHRVRAKDGLGNALPDYVTTADLAIGSGTRGRSYVCLDQDSAWQTPISWFGQPEKRWDLSPGFDLSNGGRRPITAECLFCHVDRVEPIPQSANRYRLPFPSGQGSIGCERCHGPGELHVTERLAGTVPEKMDTSIVNPKHLSAELRASICAQCHLQGEMRVTRLGRNISDFRPGLPWESFVSVYVRHPDIVDLHHSVGQFEQMHVSRCFTNSGGRFGCTSCHDPHSTPRTETAGAFYRDRCLDCHGQEWKTCSEQLAARQSKNDMCTVCHMPRSSSSNIVHASVTDHRVLRRPAPPRVGGQLAPDSMPLIPFAIGAQFSAGVEGERDLGIALSKKIGQTPPRSAAREIVIRLADERLNASLAVWRNDLLAWTSLCAVRESQGDANAFLQAATAAVELAPDSLEAQSRLSQAAASAGKHDLAVQAADRAIHINPRAIEPWLLRAAANEQQRRWADAESDCREALRIHPLHPQARLLLALCFHNRGDHGAAEREVEIAIRLTTKPQQQEAIRNWYRSRTR